MDHERYARSGGLAAWVDAADEALDVVVREKWARVTALDRDVRASAIRLARAEESPVMVAIAGAIALDAWDTARTLAGAPEMRVVGRWAPKGSAALPSLRAALEVATSPRPTIGLGEVSLVVAETTDDAKVAIARGAWKGVEWMPVHATRSSSQRAKGETRLTLWLDVQAAMRAAIEGWRGHPEAFRWATLATLGRWERCTKAEKLGADTGKKGRGFMQTALVVVPVELLAREAGHETRVVRDAVRGMRRRLCDALLERDLIPPPKRGPSRARGAAAFDVAATLG